MQTHCQNLTMTQRNYLFILLHKFEQFFDGKFVAWKTDPVGFELKYDAKPIWSQPYPVPKVHEEIFKKEVETLVLL